MIVKLIHKIHRFLLRRSASPGIQKHVFFISFFTRNEGDAGCGCLWFKKLIHRYIVPVFGRFGYLKFRNVVFSYISTIDLFLSLRNLLGLYYRLFEFKLSQSNALFDYLIQGKSHIAVLLSDCFNHIFEFSQAVSSQRFVIRSHLWKHEMCTCLWGQWKNLILVYLFNFAKKNFLSSYVWILL